MEDARTTRRALLTSAAAFAAGALGRRLCAANGALAAGQQNLRGRFSGSLQTGPGIPREELLAMDGLASDFMTKYQVPGLSVAIATQDRLVYRRALGWANRAAGERLTPQHRFRIASVTKPITSTTIFRLIEAGRLRLSDRVFGEGGVLERLYHGPYHPNVEQITIEHLLTHTAGGWQNDGSDPMFSNPQLNQRGLIAWTLQNRPLDHRPGTHYAYSNFGYCVLGRVIERFTGMPYEAAALRLTLHPCDVTGMRIAGNTLAQRAPGEVVYYGQKGENPYDMKVSRMDSHGGWIARATELVRFLMRVDGFPQRPDMLQPETINVMTTGSQANKGYAKGWAVNSAHNYWHDGSLPGSQTIMVRTSGGCCWAALANTRLPGSDVGLALDNLIWAMVGKVKTWPSSDLLAPRGADKEE